MRGKKGYVAAAGGPECRRCGRRKTLGMRYLEDVFIIWDSALCGECLAFDAESAAVAQMTIWDAIDAA